jgi:hypothetical protein
MLKYSREECTTSETVSSGIDLLKINIIEISTARYLDEFLQFIQLILELNRKAVKLGVRAAKREAGLSESSFLFPLHQ